MKFYASVKPKKFGEAPPTLIIEADAAFDAEALAKGELGTDGFMFQRTGDDAIPSIEIRWVGNDYAPKHSAEDGLRMQIRERLPDLSWGDWRPV